MKKRGFCIYTTTVFQGPVPSVKEILPDDTVDTTERICVFPTELDAQREIADAMMTRLQQFIDGERDFNDATTCDEYVVEVEVLSDGSIVDAIEMNTRD
jgi:hypothetical protein